MACAEKLQVSNAAHTKRRLRSTVFFLGKMARDSIIDIVMPSIRTDLQGSTFQGFAAGAQVMVVDIPATAAAGRGVAIGSLIMVIDVAAGTVALLRIAPRTQVVIIDIAATAAALLRVAIGALVVVIDVATGAATQLGVARGA